MNRPKYVMNRPCPPEEGGLQVFRCTPRKYYPPKEQNKNYF